MNEPINHMFKSNYKIAVNEIILMFYLNPEKDQVFLVDFQLHGPDKSICKQLTKQV